MKRFHVLLTAAALVAFGDHADARTKIQIDNAEVTLDVLRDKGILSQLDNEYPDRLDHDGRRRLESTVEQILASYRHGEHVRSLTADEFRDYLAVDYEFLFRNVLHTSSLKNFIAQQEKLVAHAADHPDLYKGRVVTVGFEHQFATYLHDRRLDDDFKYQMVAGKDLGPPEYTEKRTGRYDWYLKNCLGTFIELDHVELAKSSKAINGLPFILETDSGAELELVTPPFLLRTGAPDIAIPDPEQVERYEAMMKDYLLALSESKGDRLLPLSDLVRHFRDNGNVVFEVEDNLVIHGSHVTYKAPVPVTKHFKRQQLNKLCIDAVRPSHKFSPLDSQVNFSATPDVYSALKYLRLARYTEKDNGVEYYRLWSFILSELRKSVADKNPSLGVMMFLVELATVATNQVAVLPLEAYYRFTHDRLDATTDRFWRDVAALEKIEDATSYVKDWASVWLKTSLRNFSKAVLTKGELEALDRQSERLRDAIVTARPAKELMVGFEPTDLEAVFRQFATNLAAGLKTWAADDALDNDFVMPRPAAERTQPKMTALRDLRDQDTSSDGFTTVTRRKHRSQKPKSLLQRLFELSVPLPAEGARIEYTFHNPAYLGPRQDTFIGDEKSNRPLARLWEGRKLFVVEVREDAPDPDFVKLAKTLRYLSERAGEDHVESFEKLGLVGACESPTKVMAPEACLNLLVEKLYYQDQLPKLTN